MKGLKRFIKKQLVSFYLDKRRTDFINIEGLVDYDFSLLPVSSHQSGVTAMLRIKNEEENIELCINSIADVFDEIVVIDNGSEDLTLLKVKNLVDEKQWKHVFIYSYPHELSRLGSDHQSTSDRSIKSFAYYSNWCLSKCSRSWVFKWDGDMVLPAHKKNVLMKIIADCIKEDIRLWVIRGKTVYIGLDEKVYSVLPEEINGEDMLFPNRPWIYFRKENKWEVLRGDFFVRSGHIEEWYFLEIKDARKDEFTHWSASEEIGDISRRKAIEYKNYSLIRSGVYNSSDVEVYCGAIEDVIK